MTTFWLSMMIFLPLFYQSVWLPIEHTKLPSFQCYSQRTCIIFSFLCIVFKLKLTALSDLLLSLRPNVAGVWGTAILAKVFRSILWGNNIHLGYCEGIKFFKDTRWILWAWNKSWFKCYWFYFCLSITVHLWIMVKNTVTNICYFIGPHDVRVRMKAVGICGSDVHYLKVKAFFWFTILIARLHGL